MPLKLFSSSGLKIFAIIFMFIDHLAATSKYLIEEHYTVYIIMRSIGRLAFPIFAFLIAEGFIHTKNVSKYLFRLSIFAVISEVPFNLALFGKYLEFTHQNVFLTLSLALIALTIYDKYKTTNPDIAFLSPLIIGIVAEVLNTDYGLIGVMIIFCFYYFRGYFLRIFSSLLFLNFLMILPFFITYFTSGKIILINTIQILSVFSLFFIYFYNNKKGFPLKYFFYVFYPLHLLILYLFNK